MSDDFDFDAFLNDIKSEMDEEPVRSSRASRQAPEPATRPRQRAAASAQASPARSRQSSPAETRRSAPAAARTSRQSAAPRKSPSGSRRRRKGSGKRRVIIAIVAVLALIGIFGGNGKKDETLDRSAVPVAETVAPTATPLPTDTPEPTAVPTPTPERVRGWLADKEVYVSNSNGIVHSRSNCSGMKYYWTTTIKAANDAGYEFCDKCW